MSGLWKKLNLKTESTVHILAAPDSFQLELAELDGPKVIRSVGKKPIEFLVAFVQTRKSVQQFADKIESQLENDAIVWFAYPKKSSKRYQCDFNRDSGWEPLGSLGFEGVRQVAIDEDWSALRFRRVEHIKRLTRDPKRLISKKAK